LGCVCRARQSALRLEHTGSARARRGGHWQAPAELGPTLDPARPRRRPAGAPRARARPGLTLFATPLAVALSEWQPRWQCPGPPDQHGPGKLRTLCPRLRKSASTQERLFKYENSADPWGLPLQRAKRYNRPGPTQLSVPVGSSLHLRLLLHGWQHWSQPGHFGRR
jgi:hypothetical protein